MLTGIAVVIIAFACFAFAIWRDRKDQQRMAVAPTPKVSSRVLLYQNGQIVADYSRCTDVDCNDGDSTFTLADGRDVTTNLPFIVEDDHA